MTSATLPAEKPVVRCAIYTRKSTDEGLEKEFNSLDAQREAGEAYIRSQTHEGWRCLPQRYDDGGFTGGNLERPALQRLLADVRAGRIDLLVVYKIDRLSRSLLDFARLVEVFDQHHVSFVAVTQQVNSATSMGRLMLNVLLSFAQFEREIIAERTRDKIAAAKRKGRWSGGTPILGYDLDPNDSKLLVNEAEAAQVRAIFALYLKHQALVPVVQELARRGWTTKRWTTRKGQPRGGRPFHKTNLHFLLTRVLYVGKVPHKQEVHDGQQPALVEEAVWQRVQDLLRRRGVDARSRQASSALLGGLVFCGPCGRAMSPGYACRKGHLRYRYYLCSHAQKHGRQACPSPSIPAAALERFVVEQIQILVSDTERLRAMACAARDANPDVPEAKEPIPEDTLDPAAWEQLSVARQGELLRRLVRRIDYDGAAAKVRITFHPDAIRTLVPTENAPCPTP
jgi:site-specific DNA recombinase